MAENSNEKEIHFFEVLYYDVNKKIDIYHLILANEDSEAGKVYNKYTYNFLTNIFNTITDPKKFDIFNEVKTEFKELAETILNKRIENPVFNSNEDIINKKIIKLQLEEELSLKKCFIDELGFSFFKTEDFEPKYNYFLADENTLEIRVEIPGNAKCNVNYESQEGKTIIKINGVKKPDSCPKKLEDNIMNLREFSEFEVIIPLSTEKYKITSKKAKEGYPKFKNGVCIIQYELASIKGEEASNEVDEL